MFARDIVVYKVHLPEFWEMEERQQFSHQEVLSYWFEGDQSVNYRTKWFPSGSSQLQSEADLSVFTRFHALFVEANSGHLDFWKISSQGQWREQMLCLK